MVRLTDTEVARKAEEVVSAARWRQLMESAPSVDDDFERDVEAGRRAIGPSKSTWPS
jgi:hypothetical protein